MKKKWLNIVLISVFLGGLGSLVPTSLAFYKEDNSTEKRARAEFPSQFSDDYFTLMNNWFNDHSPFRDLIINFHSRVTKAMEDAFYNWIIDTFYKQPAPTPAPTPEESSSSSSSPSSDSSSDPSSDSSSDPSSDSSSSDSQQSSESSRPFDYDLDLPYPYLDVGASSYPAREQGQVIYGREDWLFFSGEGSLDDYRGANVLSDERMETYANSIKDLTEYFSSKGIELVVLVPPNKEQIYADKMPTYSIVHKAKKAHRLEYYLHQRGVSNFLYPLEHMIQSRADGKDIFLKQDTHWNSLGAAHCLDYLNGYFGFGEDKYEAVATVSKGGDLARMISYEGDQYETYVAQFEKDMNVTVTEDSASGVVAYTSDAENDKQCFVIGDSFRTMLGSGLARHFSKTYVAHKNVLLNEELVFNMAEYLKGLKPGDCLMIESVERALSIIPGLGQSLQALLEE